MSMSIYSAQQEAVLKVHIEEAGYETGSAAIQDIEFKVMPGELLGLIGPNGAGKSTTIKAILGLLKECKASVTISGDPPRYAYVPESPVYYEDLTLWEHLDLAAAAFGMEDQQFEIQANLLLEQFDMTAVRDKLPGGFSKGMKQKMMLMIGFLSRPDVYIVDEPFIGLDPRATKDFLELLDRERKRGAGILMCTHVLDTAERICDSFILMSKGKIASRGTLEDIRLAAGQPNASLFDCFTLLA
ncbi:multidrug ABC transporter ATP-binding protein [Paenibacillus sp. J45TS6]|uniref:ABC transporter ATP-binding protein n=2 Tax=unclassified Paenibacillus TaxID=185978 RepID=UPI001B286DB5|nr:ABC transporter ATP-binding protein [Paenibacillus sp. J45TS6]GIP42758.1 multidrug ABC transporter ATP-binding protein [Paenibacillus sp. J45TS6]